MVSEGSVVSGGRKPRVHVILTGGTIGTAGVDELDMLDYTDYGTVLGDDAIPLYRFPDGVEVVSQRIAKIRSTDVDETVWRTLYASVMDAVAQGADGVVIAHGTATLEETAYLLHLSLPTTVPVVLVGAQRPPTSLGSDAQLNLLAAVRTAASPQSAGRGVLVVMDDLILSARDVTKSSNHRLDAFQARDRGALGDVDPYGVVWFDRRLDRSHTVDSRFSGLFDRRQESLPRVDIITSYAGADGGLVEAAVRLGARGIVVASLPPSMNPSALNDALDRAIADGVLVVSGTRGTTGRTVQRRSWAERGIVAADTLSVQAARLLAMLCLASGLTRDETVRVFASH